MNPVVTGLPAGVTKIGIVQFDGQPARVWWAFPDGSVQSSNLEGGDIYKTPFSYDASEPKDHYYGFTQWHPVLEQARKLRYEDGAIYPE